MHNRKPDGLESREIGSRDGLVLVPLVLCILGLALYPQLILKRTDASVQAARSQRSSGAGSTRLEASPARGSDGVPKPARPERPMNFNAPDIDYAALSPVIALTVGALRRPAHRRLQAAAAHRAGPDPDHARRPRPGC